MSRLLENCDRKCPHVVNGEQLCKHVYDCRPAVCLEQVALMKTPKTPRAPYMKTHSMIHKLRVFFSMNEDEELSLDDICTKLECDRFQAKRIIAKLTARDGMEYVTVLRLRSKGVAK